MFARACVCVCVGILHMDVCSFSKTFVKTKLFFLRDIARFNSNLLTHIYICCPKIYTFHDSERMSFLLRNIPNYDELFEGDLVKTKYPKIYGAERFL